MQSIRRLSVIDQTVTHLRNELRGGRWSGRLPGVLQLAAACDVSSRVMRAALRRLETEGLLSGRGPGRGRGIAAPAVADAAVRSLRVAILLHDTKDLQLGYMVELQHSLEAAGHAVCIARKSQVDLKFDVWRIGRQVNATPADAWVVSAGTREVLEWFSRQAVPGIAMFGRRRGVPIAGAGPDKVPAYAAATRELIRLGHRRIVLLCRKLRRLPEPGAIERAYLAELAAHGIETSAYNLPDWEETVEGLHARLAALFKISPPTALIVDETPLFIAAQQFLAARNLRVPQHVSLVCTDHDAAFDWCQPAVSHIRWDAQPVIRRVVRWTAAVSKGRRDLKQTLAPAEFVRGGTIGPVWDKPEDHKTEDRTADCADYFTLPPTHVRRGGRLPFRA